MKSLLHFFRCVAGIDGPATQVTSSELSVILDHSRSATVLVEIGCFEGATTAALAANASDGRVYSIDPFFAGRAGVAYGYWIARLELWRKKLRNVRLIRAFSREAAPRFDQPVDFLFIDGDHSLQGIQRDWSDWFPKVKSGGVIAMHDCRISGNSPVELGTMQFYRERLSHTPELREVAAVDSLTVFRKL